MPDCVNASIDALYQLYAAWHTRTACHGVQLQISTACHCISRFLSTLRSSMSYAPLSYSEGRGTAGVGCLVPVCIVLYKACQSKCEQFSNQNNNLLLLQSKREKTSEAFGVDMRLLGCRHLRFRGACQAPYGTKWTFWLEDSRDPSLLWLALGRWNLVSTRRLVFLFTERRLKSSRFGASAMDFASEVECCCDNRSLCF